MDTQSPSRPKSSQTSAHSAERHAVLRAWWAARRMRPSLFAREILVVLAIKVVLLFILKHAFFDKPVAKHMSLPPDDVARALLGPIGPNGPSSPLNAATHPPTHAQGVRNDK